MPNAMKLKIDNEKSAQPKLWSGNKESASTAADASNMRSKPERPLKGNGKSGFADLLNNAMKPRPTELKAKGNKAM